MRFVAGALATFVVATSTLAGQSAYRTLDDRFAPPHYESASAWNARAAYLREHVLASAGLLPLPEKTPLNPSIFGEVKRSDYTVSKVYFESLRVFRHRQSLPADWRRTFSSDPVAARPLGLRTTREHPHQFGTWTGHQPGATGLRGVRLRHGGYNDSQQVPHTFSGPREYLWGLSLSGLQLWDSIRALDFLETLPYVRKNAIGMTGESGGGTQTFLASAVDPRIAVSAPVNMISLHMQGGCLCENPPGLRLETTNVEIASTIAPRPLLMISATGDWTSDTLELEYPAVRAIYNLVDASDRVRAVRMTAEHNYNKDSREAMYAWMARWLQNAPADVHPAERSFTPEPLQSLLVFQGRAMPPNAVDVAGLTNEWIDAAKRQLASARSDVFSSTLRHALSFAGEDLPAKQVLPAQGGSHTNSTGNDRTVLIGAANPELERALTSAGFHGIAIPFTPFNAEAAAKIHHFETYNRTPASQRVADIVAAVRAHPGAALVAEGDGALAAILAAAIVPIRLAVLDVAGFDTASDQAFVDHVYIPGLRRAGDFQTAAAMSRGELIVHNAGASFAVPALHPQASKLTAAEIAAIVRKAPSTRTR